MTAYGITIVDDDVLLDGHDFAFVAIPDGGGWIFYRASALGSESLEDSWAAYRALLANGDGGDDARQLAPGDAPQRYAECDHLRAI